MTKLWWGAVVLSALLGGGARWMVGGARALGQPPATADVQSPPASPIPDGPCGELSVELAATRSHQLALGLLRGRIAALEQERVEIAGEPTEWEGEPPAGAGPDEAEATLLAVAEASGARLVEIDCDEMPCVASLRWVFREDEEFNSQVEAVDEAVRGSLEGLSFGGNTSLKSEDGALIYSIDGMLWDSSDKGRFRGERIGFRRRAIGELADQAPYDEGELAQFAPVEDEGAGQE